MDSLKRNRFTEGLTVQYKSERYYRGKLGAKKKPCAYHKNHFIGIYVPSISYGNFDIDI